MRKTIYYTGVGSTPKKTKFTNAEFMNIMDKDSNTLCPNYFLRKSNKNCMKVKQMNKQMAAKNNFNNMKTKKYKNVSKKCAKGLSNKMFKCNLNQYIEFSGAVKIKK